VNNLKAELYENGIEIHSKTSVGYSMVMRDAQKADLFLQKVSNRSKNPLFGRKLTQEYKVNYIIRRLLTAKRRIPLEILCDELFYSVSSVRRELKKIEEILSNYQLKLTLKRGYGYAIEGNEWGKRLCLLAQHKIFVNLAESDQRTESEFVRVFCIGDKEMRKRRHAVRDAIYESNLLSYKMIHMQVLTNYISLLQTRKAYADEIIITEEQEQAIHNSGILPEAVRILSAAGEEYTNDATEVRTYAMLLLAFRNVLHISQLSQKEFAILQKEVKEMTNSREQGLLREITMSEERDAFLCCWSGIRNRMLFSVNMDGEDVREILQPDPIAEEQCVLLAKYIQKRYGIRVPIRQLSAVYYVFLRFLTKQYKEAFRYRIAVVSSYGYYYANFCAQYIKQEYEFYIKEAEAIEFTEMKKKSLEHYDFLLHDMKSDMLEEFASGGANVTFLRMGVVVRGNQHIRLLDKELQRRKQHEKEQLFHKHAIQAESLEEALKTISCLMMPDNSTGFEEDLKEQLEYDTLQMRGDTLFLTAVVPDDRVGIYCYELEKGIFVKRRWKHRIICCFHNYHDYRKLLRMEEILLENLRE